MPAVKKRREEAETPTRLESGHGLDARRHSGHHGLHLSEERQRRLRTRGQHERCGHGGLTTVVGVLWRDTPAIETAAPWRLTPPQSGGLIAWSERRIRNPSRALWPRIRRRWRARPPVPLHDAAFDRKPDKRASHQTSDVSRLVAAAADPERRAAVAAWTQRAALCSGFWGSSPKARERLSETAAAECARKEESRRDSAAERVPGHGGMPAGQQCEVWMRLAYVSCAFGWSRVFVGPLCL